MKSDVPSSAPQPPNRQGGDGRLLGSNPLSNARSRSVEQLARDLESALRSGRAGLDLTPGEDGSSRIPSLIAVWLISQVGKAIGVKKPVNLSKITNKEDLRSVGGVARVLHDALHPLAQEAVA